jgi:hypothetical protein
MTDMFKRIAAIAFIFFCTSLAWIILGTTISLRTDSLGSEIQPRMLSNWGTPQTQTQPTATYVLPAAIPATDDADKPSSKPQPQPRFSSLPIENSQIRVALHLDQRKKGLLWYSTYRNSFDGSYSFKNPSDRTLSVTFALHLPAEHAVYDDMRMTLDDSPLSVNSQAGIARATAFVNPQSEAKLRVSYRSQGLDSWTYSFGEAANGVRNFTLQVNTDFEGFNFGDDTLSPTSERADGTGRELTWKYTNLVSGFPISVRMPEKIQPGPLAGRISFFAPVSLFFFFFVLFILCTVRGIDLHPVNYFFLACTFFSFHLLLAYLVDHISIHLAFAISSAVSIFLLVSYLRLVVSPRFALVEAGLIQFVYLVLFSYAFFFDGFTGLTITIGAILTLYIVMRTTARVQWAEVFARPVS